MKAAPVAAYVALEDGVEFAIPVVVAVQDTALVVAYASGFCCAGASEIVLDIVWWSV